MEEKVPGPETEKKKKRRLTKKDLENEKRLICLQTLLECDSLPPTVLKVLKEEETEKGRVYKLSPKELEKFWKEFLVFVRERVAELVSADGTRDVSKVVSAVVGLLQYTAMFHSVVESETFTQMAVILNMAMSDDTCPPQLQNEICQLCEYCCIKNLKIPGEFYLDTFIHLFDLTLDEKKTSDLKPIVKRMWEMHVALSRMNLRTQSCEPIVSKLVRVVASPLYLSLKEGRQFITFAFTLDVKLIKKFHQAVKDFLPKCKRSQADAYGEVYYSAWVNGSPEVREVLQTQCIQNFMTHMFLFPRKKQELSNTGQNVLAILSHLHSHRTISHFSKTLTELYMPLLWRHLRSGNNVERCNAASLFLDIYPLEKPGSGRAEESDFLDKQHNEMVDLLTDTCHVVRIIAIKGICHKLCTAWSTFPQETVQVLMRNLVALSNDGSTYQVRRTLYESFSVLLKNPDSAAYIARVLPSLHDYVHDENEKVRRAFIKLLCDIKALPDPAPIKYWKVVSFNHFAARLELENVEVGFMLSKLLMSSIYSPDMAVDKFLFRLIKFIGTSPQAARKLFLFSYKVLDYKNAVRVMLTILINLRAHVKKKEMLAVQSQEEEVKNGQSMVSNRKKRRSAETLTNEDEQGDSDDKENDSQTENRVNASTSSVSSVSRDEQVPEEDDEYELPGVSHTLVDIVSLLWSMHSNKLADPVNEEDLNHLQNMACAGVPLFLKYYKGSPTYFAVVHLASLLPAAKLTPMSTVCSACVSRLRNISEMTPQAEINVTIHALCSWNRFAEIQDLVVDWLDQGFRCEGLNQSCLPTIDIKQRKVRFVAKGGKPMLALQLLDAVFSHPLNAKRVMKKSYNQVHELFVYLGRIKVLVERRLLGGLPLDSPMLSDEFLIKCLYRYTKLILNLHKPEPQIAHENTIVDDVYDASSHFKKVIDWTLIVVRPMLPQNLEENSDMSVLLLKNILRAASNLVELNYAQEDTLIRLAEFVRNLLNTECSLWFVESSLILLKHIKDHSEALYGPTDEAELMKTVVPSLLSQALRSLSDKYTKEQVTDNIQNLFEVKTAIYEVLTCLRRIFSPQSPLLRTVLKLFTDSLVAIIVHDVKQLQLLDTVDKVQELPFVCGMLISIVSRPTLVQLWLSTVPSSISQLYSKDGNLLVAVVSLLHTLAHSGLLLPKPELEAAVKEAYATVTSFTRESTQSEPVPDDSSFSTTSIDVKKEATPVLLELAVFLKCPLR